MGVSKLWDLLAPCGRRCSVDALARQRLAVDASIWLIQFIKAMRDESGEMIAHAPLLGLFRRVCKLLFLHVRPVLVFDGATPVLKQRTVARRQAFRRQQEGNMKRTAEKILLNRLKGKHLLHGIHANAHAPAVEDEAAAEEERPAAAHAPRLPAQFDEEDARLAGQFGEAAAREEGGVGEPSLQAFIDAAASKDGGGQSGVGAGHLSVTGAARLALGSIVVPRAADLDTEAIRHLPPALQFELLDEIKLNERNRRRDELLRVEHTAESFSHQQLRNYIEVSKVAGQVSKLRAELSEAAVAARRLAGDETREYILMDTTAQHGEEEGEEESDSEETPARRAARAIEDIKAKRARQAERKAAAAAAAAAGPDAEEEEMARAVALSMESAAAVARREGKRRAGPLLRTEVEGEEGEEGEETAAAYGMGGFFPEEGETSGNGFFPEEGESSGNGFFPEAGDSSGDGFFPEAGEPSDDGELRRHEKATTIAHDEGKSVSHDEGKSVSLMGDRDTSGERKAHSSRSPTSPSEGSTKVNDVVGVFEYKSKSPSGDSAARAAEPRPVTESTAVEGSAQASEEEDIEITFDLDTDESDAEDDLFPSSLFHKPPVHPPNPYTPTSEGPRAEETSATHEATDDDPAELVEVDSGVSLVVAPTLSGASDFDKSSAWRMYAKKRLWSATKFTHLENSSSSFPSQGQGHSHQEIEPSPLEAPRREEGTLSSDDEEAQLAAALAMSKEVLAPSGAPRPPVVEEAACANTSGGVESPARAEVADADPPRSSSPTVGRATSATPETANLAAATAPALSEAERQAMRRSLAEESRALQEQQRKQKRDAEQVTHEMYEDSKRLLTLFGVPYIVAPEEAEAQCAQLETASLVDGVVTEDNDAFLFGARHVYKNLFDPNRHVECYHMDDVERELAVDRRKLIDLALLLGSDYTDGVHGIGIVNAMEVVTSFDEEAGGLSAFADFVRSWTDGTEATEEAHDRVRAYKRKHKAMRRQWVLSEGFPSAQVVAAYAKPRVDHDERPLEWARPDLHGLRCFAADKFGWTQDKADELLLPVIRAFDETFTQTRIESFFPFEHRFARFSSTRLAATVKHPASTVHGSATAPAAAAPRAGAATKRSRTATREEAVDAAPARTTAGASRAAGPGGRKKRVPKAAGPPGTQTKRTRSRSGYDLFGEAERKALKQSAETPTDAKEFFRIIGEKWRALSAEAKSEWNERAKASASSAIVPEAAAAEIDGCQQASPQAEATQNAHHADVSMTQTPEAEGEESDDYELAW